MRRAAELNVSIIDTVYITRLLVADGTIFGAYGFDIVDGTPVQIHADAVILAAGGHTRIWRHTSSRRDENTGDSFRLAALAGARIRDAELVQFHPSGLLEPDDAAGTLVSEAARGEGGILTNALGERFMERYDPERMELSTRDRVALAAFTEVAEGRGTEKGGVYLDVSHLPRETILEEAAAGLPHADRPADAGHHHDQDGNRPHRPLLDGRGLGSTGGPQHGSGRAVCNRRGFLRSAWGQPVRWQFTD
jgi:succinate dehydrogenase / fumarate reductase flavoprotein subunit